jgi:hypothetical protein
MITHCGLLWHCYVSCKSVACGKRQEQNLNCLSGDAPKFNRGRMSQMLGKIGFGVFMMRQYNLIIMQWRLICRNNAAAVHISALVSRRVDHPVWLSQ